MGGLVLGSIIFEVPGSIKAMASEARNLQYLAFGASGSWTLVDPASLLSHLVGLIGAPSKADPSRDARDHINRRILQGIFKKT